MSKQSLLKMFLIVVVTSTIILFLGGTAIGIFLNFILFIAYALGILLLIINAIGQIFTICLTLVMGRKNEEWTNELNMMNGWMLVTGIFCTAIAISYIIYQIQDQTSLQTMDFDAFLWIGCLQLPLLFLNKKIRGDYRWTFLINMLALSVICYKLYHSLDALQGFGAGS